MFIPRMQTESRVADNGDRDTRKKVRAAHRFAEDSTSNLKSDLLR
jgi:hypothetical protein